MKELTEADISKEYRKQLTMQSYDPKPKIDGARIIDLKVFTDDSGSFMELSRFIHERLKDFQEFEIKQMNFSLMEPSALKAAHLHFFQDDIWFVPPTDRVLVGLLDCRDVSDTKDLEMRFVMGAGRAQLLFIPRGVAHGLKNIGTTTASILYMVNNEFDPDPLHTDEHRLPWTVFSEDFWEMSKE